MLVSEFLDDVGRQLNDMRPEAPHYRWTVEMLLHYLNLGMEAIAMVRPDAITYPPQTVTLVPGSVQSLPAGMTSITGIQGPNGAITEFDHFMASIPDDPCIYPVSRDCDGNVVYKAYGYAYDGVTQKFSVYPPVPAEGGPFTLTVSGNPGAFLDPALQLTLSGKYLPALEAWMLHKAYEVDTESATSGAMSSTQYKIFKDLLYGSLQVEIALKNNKALRV
jgi:hypothetical protein